MEFFKDKKNNILIIAVLFFLIFTASLVLIENNFKEEEQTKSTTTNTTATTSKKENNLLDKEELKDLCAPFDKMSKTPTSTKVSCKEAINKALKEYPGEIKDVKLDVSDIKLATGRQKENPEKTVKIRFWMVEIDLNENFTFKGDEIKKIIAKIGAYNRELSLHKAFIKNE